GGHTNNKIRVSTKPVRAVADDLDILVAFDQETIDFNFHELHSGGIVMADAKFNPVIPEREGVVLYAVPFTDIATSLGNSLMKNMVAIGATSAVLGLDPAVFESVVADTFGRKGAQVVEKNMEAIRAGAEYMKEQLGERAEPMKLAKADGKQRMFMIGNDAIALGALAGGARFMAAYPITPASEIMEYLISKLPDLGGTV
ncbi:2-oxoacid:acceptor oxidoreductase family protein, partial [Anoxybacillus geothermalis]|nr:2-oxoacid:acceptor oxidoreductase family protein [Anoxybacillus geothermalis]